MAKRGELKVGDYVVVAGRTDQWPHQGCVGRIHRMYDWRPHTCWVANDENPSHAQVVFRAPEDEEDTFRQYHVRWLRKAHDLETLARLEELP